MWGIYHRVLAFTFAAAASSGRGKRPRQMAEEAEADAEQGQAESAAWTVGRCVTHLEAQVPRCRWSPGGMCHVMYTASVELPLEYPIHSQTTGKPSVGLCSSQRCLPFQLVLIWGRGGGGEWGGDCLEPSSFRWAGTIAWKASTAPSFKT